MRSAVGAFSQYEAQVASVNHQLERMIALHKLTDARGFANLQNAARTADKTFRNAVASTGQFEVRQLRLNSATDDYIKKLNAQKLSFRQLAKQRSIANAAYKQQLALENMSIQQGVGGHASNKGVYTSVVPKEFAAELDTARKRLGFLGAELASGGRQMVNWGKNTQWAGRQLMVGFTMPIAALGAATGVLAYQVDKELTRIAKVYDTTAQEGIAREKELLAVRQDSLSTATAAAREYGYAAKETLQITAALAATGKTGNELQRSTLEVQRISRLGEVEQQTAIDATIALQSIWKQSNEELTESFDYMNSVENATSLQTADFAAAIPIAGAAVKAFGGDIQELGVLLTAMRENGIGAVQGANALKATMQRLGRPSKQIRMEWQEITGTDITSLVEQSNSLTEVFQKINEATRDLAPAKQRKAFAGLFGSYQVARMMAMTKGMEDLENGVGQVSTAFEVAQQDSSEWASTAAKEIEQYQKSVSGQWDTALAEMKLQLAGMGEPFVKVATKIVNGITSIIETFQKLPSVVKWFAGVSVVAIGLAGGLLMLTGLFANLAGNGVMVVASLMKLAGKMNLIDSESKAMELSSKLASNAFKSEAHAATILSNQLDILTASLKEADLAQRGLAGAPRLRMSMDAQRSAASAAYMRKQDTNDARRANYDAAVAQFAQTDSLGRTRYRNTNPEIKDSRGKTKVWMNQEETHMSALGVLREEAVAMEKDRVASIATGSKLTGETAAKEAKRNQLLKSGSALMVVQSAAMAAMVLPLGDTVNQAAQLVMVAGLVAPAFAAVAPQVAKIASATKAVTVSAIAARRGAVGVSGAWAIARTAVVGFGRAIHMAMGPVGWIVAGITAAAGIAYKVYKDNKKEREQALKDQKTLTNLSKDYAENTGRAWRDYVSLAKYRVGSPAKDEQTMFDTSIEHWRGEGGKEEVKVYSDLSSAEKTRAELELFRDSQIHMNMTVEEATQNVKAFMIAAGEGYAAANIRTRKLVGELGNLKTTAGWFKVLTDRATEFGDAMDAASPEDVNALITNKDGQLTDVANDLVGTFQEAIKRSKSSADINAAVEAFAGATTGQFENIWEKFSEKNEAAVKLLADKGINSIQELRARLKEMSGSEKSAFYSELEVEGGLAQTDLLELVSAAAAAESVEGSLVKAYATAMGLEGSFEKISDLMKDPAIAQALDLRDQKKMVDEISKSFEDRKTAFLLPKYLKDGADEAERIRVNAMLTSQGLKEGADLAEALQNWYKQIPAEKVAEQVAKMGEGLDRAAFSAGRLSMNLSPAGVARAFGGYDKLKDAMKSTMQGIQDEIADGEKEALDAQIDASKEKAQAYWDAEKEAMDARHEREKEALEKAWDGKRERVEAYWDARIDGIDKAIEKEEKAEERRKRIFEAEMSRIQRLADIANTRIDFNVALNEGNLDEAARIQNNAQAEDARFIFDTEAERGSKKSERKVDRLDQSKDAIKKNKDEALKAFDEREKRAKESFDKIQKMEKDSLEKRAKNDMAAKEQGWKRERKMLDQTLKTFKAFVPKNAAELKAHMKDLGIAMRNFGDGTLKTTSKEWGDYVGDAMRRGLSDAALVHASDDSWEKMAARAVRKLIRGLGFNGREHYNSFMKTGKIRAPGSGMSVGDIAHRHTGGLIGSRGGDSRKGVARTYHGDHSSEVTVRARKGEYMVNEHATKKHRNVLEAINKGTYKDDVMGGAGDGPAALISGMVGQSYLRKFSDLIGRRVASAKEKEGFYTTNSPSVYNLGNVKPWVAEAAAYLGSKFGITSIGGVADRTNNPFSDHPRGLAIDFMTSEVNRGNALAKEALSLGSKLDATYMIWQKKIHSFDARGWRDYRHPSGNSNPTLDHMDHIHMSFSPNGRAGDLPTTFGGALIQGPGGQYHPTGGVGRTGSRLHGSPLALDIALPEGNKIYAVRDGVVSGSYDLRGHEPRARHGGKGYRSYGRVITVNHDGGGSSLYAHLSSRIAQAGQRVNAGTVIGRSGDTGNSSGPHLHFGATPGPGAFLRKGAEFVKYDNTAATLHRGESVLTKNLTQKMHQGVDLFANGGGAGYNIEVNIDGYNQNPEELAREVVKIIKREQSRAPQSRSVGGKP